MAYSKKEKERKGALPFLRAARHHVDDINT